MCLTIGSRGDVQPYIALGLGLKKEGHQVTIVTHEEYKEWVEGFGIEHRTAGGDPGALMKLSVEHKMFSPEFFKESLTNFRQWLDELLVDAWEQCQGAEVLLESPSAMAGVHIAEALNIPYFRCFTMPWTKYGYGV
jgi:sterol 3beta-glucosyltransferase